MASWTRSPGPMTACRRQQVLRSDSAGRFCSRILSLLALWEISCTVFLQRSRLRRLVIAMSGHKACSPDAPKSVKKQGFSLDEKMWILSQSEKGVPPKTIAIEIGRAPSTDYTSYSNKPILRNFEFLPTLPPPPLDLGFCHFLTFLHRGIEEVERHLLWKFHKKIQRESWSNVPPKLLAYIRFLYKVVHKNGRLRKFNRSREI